MKSEKESCLFFWQANNPPSSPFKSKKIYKKRSRLSQKDRARPKTYYYSIIIIHMVFPLSNNQIIIITIFIYFLPFIISIIIIISTHNKLIWSERFERCAIVQWWWWWCQGRKKESKAPQCFHETSIWLSEHPSKSIWFTAYFTR